MIKPNKNLYIETRATLFVLCILAGIYIFIAGLFIGGGMMRFTFQ